MSDERTLEELLAAGREALEDERVLEALETQRRNEEDRKRYTESWALARKAVTDEYPALAPYVKGDRRQEAWSENAQPAREFDEVLIKLPQHAAVLVSVRKVFDRYEMSEKYYAVLARGNGGYDQPITVNHWVLMDLSDGDGDWHIVVGSVAGRYEKGDLLKALAFAKEVGGKEKLEDELADRKIIAETKDEELPF